MRIETGISYKMNNEFQEVFQSKPIRVFECPKNLGEIIVGQTIKQGKFFLKNFVQTKRKI